MPGNAARAGEPAATSTPATSTHVTTSAPSARAARPPPAPRTALPPADGIPFPPTVGRPVRRGHDNEFVPGSLTLGTAFEASSCYPDGPSYGPAHSESRR